jgi:hypothetical protein
MAVILFSSLALVLLIALLFIWVYWLKFKQKSKVNYP